MTATMRPEAVEAARESGLTAAEVHRALANLRGVGGFIDPAASVHPTAIVWHYAVILADVVLSAGVSIGSHCEIGKGSIIGERTRIGSGTFLPAKTMVGRDTFIGPHVTMTDDRAPVVRSSCCKDYHAEPPIIGDSVSIGAGATLCPGVRIGKGARIGAASVVTHDVPEGAFVYGVPARERPVSDAAAAWLADL